MESTIKAMPFGAGIVIVTENADGEIYTITAEYFRDILDDWNGDCNFVPANDARVFFAAWNGKPLNPHEYQDFESLVRLLQRGLAELREDNGMLCIEEVEENE